MPLLYPTILPTYATVLVARTLGPVSLNTCTTSPTLNLVAAGVIAETEGKGKTTGERGRGGYRKLVGGGGRRDSGTRKGKLRREAERSQEEGGRGTAGEGRGGEGKERR
jgi:hypothetical protein